MMSHNETHSQFINKYLKTSKGTSSSLEYNDISIKQRLLRHHNTTVVEDTARVRLMNDGNVEREGFVQLTTPEICARSGVFESVVETGDFYFFSARSGSSYSFTDASPGYLRLTFASFTTSLSNIEDHVHPEVNIHVQLMYVGSV